MTTVTDGPSESRDRTSVGAGGAHRPGRGDDPFLTQCQERR